MRSSCCWIGLRKSDSRCRSCASARFCSRRSPPAGAAGAGSTGASLRPRREHPVAVVVQIAIEARAPRRRRPATARRPWRAADAGRARRRPARPRSPAAPRSAPRAFRCRDGWSARRAAADWAVAARAARASAAPSRRRRIRRPAPARGRRENRIRRGSRAAPARACAAPVSGNATARSRPAAAARPDAARSSRCAGPAPTARAPESGASSPAIARSSVDLPAPLGPSRPTRSPASSGQSTSARMRRSP